MRRALLCLAVGALGCAGSPEDAPRASAPAGPDAAAPAKPGAPVEVRSSASGDRVRLELRFGADGNDVHVSLRGVGGLVVAGDARPVAGRRVAAGETLVLEVGVTPGPGHSNLAVLVSGQFGGTPRSRAASVSFGGLEREDVRALDRRDDGHGRPLKLGRGEIR